MAYLTQADLTTHMYADIITEIIRGDNTVAGRAISAALSEAKSYLSKYDLTQLFADNPVPDDENLKNKVKDIACWHLVKLSNPNIELELFRTVYKDAIGWFEKIQKGGADPEGWPYRNTATDTKPPEGNSISYSSNKKRSHHF